jgi:hypothetical protein
MTLTDYLIDLALIGIVFLQLRGRQLTVRSLLLPVALVAWAASSYLHSIPTAGNDLILIAACAATGIALGSAAGLLTRVTTAGNGVPFAKAGVAAAVLWVLGVGFRFAFQMYASHGGAGSIGSFSTHNHITAQAWVAALVLMAIGEALARTAVLAVRAYGPARHTASASVMIGAR